MTLENEEGNIGEEAFFHSCYFQEQDQYQYQGKLSKCLLILYLSLSIMHVFTSQSFQKLFTQNYFYVNSTTIRTI